VPPPPPPAPLPPPPRARCIVPRVVGLKLALAQRKIRKAHCSVGGLRRKQAPRAKVGVVLAQKPRARAIRRSGYPVSLLVGKR
jgi:beta-lactam-binding protein with PASTA domain